jgi:hypothetical protein
MHLAGRAKPFTTARVAAQNYQIDQSNDLVRHQTITQYPKIRLAFEQTT